MKQSLVLLCILTFQQEFVVQYPVQGFEDEGGQGKVADLLLLELAAQLLEPGVINIHNYN